jgi:transcription antitermination protein NusB
MSRKLAREAAMRLMYEYEITDILAMTSLYEMPDVLGVEKMSPANIEYIDSIVQDYPSKKEEIDEIIGKNSISWNLDRISKVDLSILRLAFYEILYTDTPNNIIINEAVEIAKKYSSEKSSKYINGVLGGYLKNKEVNS